MNKNDPLFIAGARGLLGSAFLRRLRQEGYRNLLIPTRGELDLTDAAAVSLFFATHRPKNVILAAGVVAGIVYNRDNPADMITQNMAIELNVIGQARNYDVERLLFFGSSCMYPRECSQPMAEEALLTGHPEPTSGAYAMAKLAGIEMCQAINRQWGQKGENRFVSLIPNTLYGPNDNFDPERSHVAPALMRRFHEARESGAPEVVLWGTGSPRRELLYVDDLVEASLMVLKAEPGSFELPLNIGSGKDISIRELSEVIRDVVGYEGLIVWDSGKPDGAPRKLLDSARINRLGWRPTVELRDGLQQMYEWYLSNGAT